MGAASRLLACLAVATLAIGMRDGGRGILQEVCFDEDAPAGPGPRSAAQADTVHHRHAHDQHGKVYQDWVHLIHEWIRILLVHVPVSIAMQKVSPVWGRGNCQAKQADLNRAQ